ncbi:MAG: hypothetical protein HOI47_29230 [Candidatus Scalindua sp.]|jgi:hypothetical protein|nr:hypothetical protein [Candidatus Scalindua sp.]
MIEIKFEAKGETIEELAQHLSMVKSLIEQRSYEGVITFHEDYCNKGNTKTSSYEYSIKNVKEDDSFITGVVIRFAGETHSMLKGCHKDLAKALIIQGIPIRSSEMIEGFILKNGTFLNRIEAAKHAIKIKQVKQDETLMLSSKLYSQDLW